MEELIDVDHATALEFLGTIITARVAFEVLRSNA